MGAERGKRPLPLRYARPHRDLLPHEKERRPCVVGAQLLDREVAVDTRTIIKGEGHQPFPRGAAEQREPVTGETLYRSDLRTEGCFACRPCDSPLHRRRYRCTDRCSGGGGLATKLERHQHSGGAHHHHRHHGEHAASPFIHPATELRPHIPLPTYPCAHEQDRGALAMSAAVRRDPDRLGDVLTAPVADHHGFQAGLADGDAVRPSRRSSTVYSFVRWL